METSINMKAFTVRGKTVLITGGRRGLGKAFALAFAEAGADVAICDCTNEGGDLEAVADEIRKFGQRALPIQADVSCKKDVDSMVEAVVTEFGDIDVLINNAGISDLATLLGTEEALWDKIIDTNLKGPYLCSQAVGQLMIKRKKGNIINIASQTGLKALAHGTAATYCISKAGLIMLTRVLARELGEYNIRVNAIASWTVKTPMIDSWLNDPEHRKNIFDLTNVPLGRFGETSDIVSATLFLASDVASWITGHTLVIDGGYLA